jgi:hypothetical protein
MWLDTAIEEGTNALEKQKSEQRLFHYKPYHRQLDFHAAGSSHRERLLMAGNQLGKTLAGGFEAADHRELPSHWPRIGGCDFGWDHPFAAVELAWDRDADVVYVTKSYRMREATPVMHASALRGWGTELRWAWPRDGRRETLEGAGIALADQYSREGLTMLPDHACFEDGSVSVEAGLMMMLDRTQSGRFKVFRHLNDWWEEFRLYHRKDGKVVKEGDDLMAEVTRAWACLSAGNGPVTADVTAPVPTKNPASCETDRGK